MKMYAGDMTVGMADWLTKQGYELEYESDSDYVDVRKVVQAPPSSELVPEVG